MRQITEREAQRLGYTAETVAPPLALKAWRNSRTGETTMMPEGIYTG